MKFISNKKKYRARKRFMVAVIIFAAAVIFLTPVFFMRMKLEGAGEFITIQRANVDSLSKCLDARGIGYRIHEGNLQVRKSNFNLLTSYCS